jgi:diacylglycerol kinase family enzyme
LQERKQYDAKMVKNKKTWKFFAKRRLKYAATGVKMKKHRNLCKRKLKYAATGVKF